MTIDDEVRRAAKLLEALIQATGASERELEALLDTTPGYIRRLLSGQIDLKLRHILAILKVLKIETGLFFETLYSSTAPPGSKVELEDLEGRFQQLGFKEKPALARPEGQRQDLVEVVRGVVQSALTRRETRDEEI